MNRWEMPLITLRLFSCLYPDRILFGFRLGARSEGNTNEVQASCVKVRYLSKMNAFVVADGSSVRTCNYLCEVMPGLSYNL
jgi:hypothetical protein